MPGAVTPGERARVRRAGTVLGPAPAELHVDTADADIGLAALYRAHYGSLVRLAVLLVGDSCTAEEVVQDSFAAMDAIACREWDSGRALPSLRAAVVRRSRSVLRHRLAAQTATTPEPDGPIACHDEHAVVEERAVVAALQVLPDVQREVVALRCYCDLSDSQIAATMGITLRAVKRHASRAMAALRPVLERES
jgi:RNA polymerase sigma factor (sigma-70 family)